MPDFLVTGASGQFGRLALDHLLDSLGVAPERIVATTRQPAALSAYAARGVSVRRADFDDPASLASAFDGVKRLLLVSTNALDDQGTRRRQQEAAVAAAAKAGVSHIVYTSLPYADTSPILFAPDHLGTEQAVAASGIEGWTLLRNDWYFENLLMSVPHALASGQWFSAGGDGRIAYVGRDDLALAAASALAGDFSGRRTLTLAGPQSYTTREVAALVSKATNRPLEVVPVDGAALARGMAAAGLPQTAAETFASFDTAQRDGKLDGNATDLESLLNRAPKRLEDWITANAAALEGAKA